MSFISQIRWDLLAFQAWYKIELLLNQELGYLNQEPDWSILIAYGPKQVCYSAAKSLGGKPLSSTQGFVAALLNELKPRVASDSTSSMRWEGTEDCFLLLLVCALFVGAVFGRRKTPACRHYLATCKTPVPVPRSVGAWNILISPPKCCIFIPWLCQHVIPTAGNASGAWAAGSRTAARGKELVQHNCAQAYDEQKIAFPCPVSSGGSNRAPSPHFWASQATLWKNQRWANFLWLCLKRRAA